MHRSDFHFELPEELIAQYPLEQRSASRLLVLNKTTGQYHDSQFSKMAELLQPGDLLVFNDTKVIPARLFGQKETGGRLEVLVERVLSEHAVAAHVRASKSPKPGTRILFDKGYEATMRERDGDLFVLDFKGPASVTALLDDIGHMPLPPYIERADAASDHERYQTVYAKKAGAVAAPTAGLHFDDTILQQLADKGVQSAWVTLHVGAGTFQPVRADDIHDHVMHKEYLEVSAETLAKVKETREQGNRVIAVGTTSVRSLESAAKFGDENGYCGDTDIFIYPGYEFQLIDGLITNFHLPESTLLMLVSALAGRENILNAYQHAVDARYRFFSYGDAMFIGDVES